MYGKTLDTKSVVKQQPATALQRSAATFAAPSPARALQQRLGNRDMRDFAGQVVAMTSAPGVTSTSVTSTSGAAMGQSLLSQPGDVHEREADRVADVVMRTTKRSTTSPNG